uniref:Uncharacterized protein n=1 Tax=Colobus angolensis palliatus TaxID=336983 RepID=A0A2K5KFR9_COLAP
MLILPRLPQWLIAEILAEGDAWDLWASVLVSAPAAFFRAQYLWGVRKQSGGHMSGGHTGNPVSVEIPSSNFKGCVPTFQATIHSTSFNNIFLHLFFLVSSIQLERYQLC